MARIFYRNIITIEVLSEDPLRGNENLSDIACLIEEGPCSGKIKRIAENEKVSGPRMARLLLDQASEPEFFGLDEDGHDLDGHEEAEPENEKAIKRRLFIEKTIRYETTYEARDEEEADSIENQIEGSTDLSAYQVLGTNRWTEEM